MKRFSSLIRKETQLRHTARRGAVRLAVTLIAVILTLIPVVAQTTTGTISGTVVDPQFGNSLAYRLDISRISGSEPLNSDLDSRPRADIAQAVEPLGEEFGLADLKHKAA